VQFVTKIEKNAAEKNQRKELGGVAFEKIEFLNATFLIKKRKLGGTNENKRI
jgi:hypothetical protein